MRQGAHRGFGMNLLQDLKHSRAPGTLCPISVRPEDGKRKRMAARSAKIETGRVYLPSDAPGLGEFLSELLALRSPDVRLRRGRVGQRRSAH